MEECREVEGDMDVQRDLKLTDIQQLSTLKRVTVSPTVQTHTHPGEEALDLRQ